MLVAFVLFTVLSFVFQNDVPLCGIYQVVFRVHSFRRVALLPADVTIENLALLTHDCSRAVVDEAALTFNLHLLALVLVLVDNSFQDSVGWQGQGSVFIEKHQAFADDTFDPIGAALQAL